MIILLRKGLFIILILLINSEVFADSNIIKAEQWLKNLSTMTADFIQVSSDGGSAEGKLFIKRGHGFRFEYLPPSPLLIVGRGSWVIVQNTQEKSSSSYPVSQTPLSQFLSENVSLELQGFNTISNERNGILSISINSEDKVGSYLKLDFSIDPFELRRWTIVDQIGTEIIVTLQNHSYGMILPAKTFRGFAIETE